MPISLETTPVLPYKERLERIVEDSCMLVLQKISSGDIEVFNEASLQLQLSVVMKSLGELYEFSSDDHFTISLEAPHKDMGTSKSIDKARCDIELSFESEKKLQAKAYIELKFFKRGKKGEGDEATTSNRYSVYQDIENLQKYRISTIPVAPTICYELLLTDNPNYATGMKSKNVIEHNQQPKIASSGEMKEIVLDDPAAKSTFKWVKFESKIPGYKEGIFFMKFKF